MIQERINSVKRSLSFRFFFTVVAMCPCGLVAQSSDPHGWYKTRWGMTPQQVLQAFAGEAQRPRRVSTVEAEQEIPPVERNGHSAPNPDLQMILQIDSFPIFDDDTPFKVMFIFNRAATPALVQVSIRIIVNEPAPRDCSSIVHSAENRLIERYGRPIARTGVHVPTITWRFRSTIIDVMRLGDDPPCFVEITYRMYRPGKL